MKILIFILGLMLISCGDAPEIDLFIDSDVDQNIIIHGIVQNGEDLEISLEAPLLAARGKTVHVAKTTIKKDNSFRIKTKIPGLGYYILKINTPEKDSIELTLNKGDEIYLNTSVDRFSAAPMVSGVSWASDVNTYQEVLNSENNEDLLSALAAKRMKENLSNPFNIVYSMHIMDREEEYNESRIQILFEVAEAYYNNYPGSEPAKNFQNQALFLRKYMENNAFYDVPDIILYQPDGSEIKLSDLRGKTVLVDFWASWCGPCRKENPNVVKLYKKYRKRNFTVFSVSLDEDATNWKQAIKSDQLIWPYHGSELKGWNSSFVSQFNIQSIPFTVLVDPQGKIIGVNLRGEDLENRLHELFKF